MLRNAAFAIQHQVRSTQDALRPSPLETFEGEVELPGQEALRALRDARGDDEARVVQALVHVAKDVLDRGQALHVVEGVLEACVERVEGAQRFHTGRREGLEGVCNAVNSGVGGVHGISRSV